MYKEIDVNNKRYARIRIWAFAYEWHQPPDPHFISESYFSLFFCGTASSGRFIVELVLTPVHQQLPEFTQTHVHQVGDTIQPSHPLSFPSPPALNLSHHQGLLK